MRRDASTWGEGCYIWNGGNEWINGVSVHTPFNTNLFPSPLVLVHIIHIFLIM